MSYKNTKDEIPRNIIYFDREYKICKITKELKVAETTLKKEKKKGADTILKRFKGRYVIYKEI